MGDSLESAFVGAHFEVCRHLENGLLAADRCQKALLCIPPGYSLLRSMNLEEPMP